MTLLALLRLSALFLELLAKPWDEFMKELNEKPFYQQWRGYIDTSIIRSKQAEGEFAAKVAAAKAAEAGGEEGVKQLPPGADAGKGSLY